MQQATSSQTRRFEIYRSADAKAFSEVSIMDVDGMTPVMSDGLDRVTAAGFDDGQQVKLLFAMPGFSLTYAWFKSAFPLPRHTHNADCLYYVIAGTLHLGSEVLSAGDGFFVGENVPYTYTPGVAGVEILEFRTKDRFNIEFLANNSAFWDRAVDIVRDRKSSWAQERRPQLLPA